MRLACLGGLHVIFGAHRDHEPTLDGLRLGRSADSLSIRKGGMDYAVLFGVRRQSGAATALWFRLTPGIAIKSGVALRLPPHSKTLAGGSPRRPWQSLWTAPLLWRFGTESGTLRVIDTGLVTELELPR